MESASSFRTMSRRYDLLILDLDGTLLDSKGRVSTRNRDAIIRARDTGLEIIIATGRALIESADPLRAIEHEHLVVAAGGSLLCDASSGRTLKRRIMPHDLVCDVTESLLGHEHKVLILKDADAAGYDYLAVGPSELDPASEWWFEVMESTVRFVHDLEDDPHPQDTLRIGIVASGSELTRIASTLETDVGDRAFLQHWPAVTSSHAIGSSTHLLEVFNPNVNKWTMIAEYCRMNAIEPQRVASIGDGLNDVDMVRESGLGIAMGNASSEVRIVADRTTGDHDEDGVAMAIEKILEGVW